MYNVQLLCLFVIAQSCRIPELGLRVTVDVDEDTFWLQLTVQQQNAMILEVSDHDVTFSVS